MAGSSTPGYHTYTPRDEYKEVIESIDQTHHSDIKYLESLWFDCTVKAVEENCMEKGAQDLTSILAIECLFEDWEFTKVIVEKSSTYYVDRNGSMSVVHGVVESGYRMNQRRLLDTKKGDDTSRIRTCAPKGK